MMRVKTTMVSAFSIFLLLRSVLLVHAASRTSLKNWRASSLVYPEGISANVPGHVLLDLFPGDQLYRDFAEQNVAWVSLLDWTYETNLVVERPTKQQVRQLFFEKLDTVSSVWLAGQNLVSNRGRTLVENAFYPNVFLLPEGNQTETSTFQLRVNIKSSIQEAKKRAKSIFNDKSYPHSVNYHVWSEPTYRNTLRKPASDFGWDWGPSFPGPGIPGEVFIEVGDPGFAFIEEGVRVEQNFAGDGSVIVKVTVSLRRLPGKAAYFQNFSVRFGSFKEVHSPVSPSDHQKLVEFRVKRPKLWYPRGSRNFRDPPNLYNLSVRLSSEIVDFRIGLRKVSTRDPFLTLTINDEAVDWLGMNVVPFDAFSARVQWNEVAFKTLRTLIDLNANAIRIWGGGYLPNDEFYQACDEAGVLIWQDLPWACAVFPATKSFLEDAFEETQMIVRKLQNHPSIAVWGGNNEVEAAFDWFCETRGQSRDLYKADYEKLFLGAIKQAVSAYSAGTSIFLDSSPTNGLFPNSTKIWGDVTDPTRGDIHFYNYSMDCEDFDSYPQALFVSEHGVQSLPERLLKYVTSANLLEPVLDSRQRHEGGFEQMDAQGLRMFNVTLSNLPYFKRAILSQIAQGRCLTTAISAWRSYEKNHGIMIWQLNDVWPGVSWSLIEVDFSWKASAYAVRRAFEPFQISLRRYPLTEEVGVFIQVSSEFRGRPLFGHAITREFCWNTLACEDTANLMFRFNAASHEQEIGRFSTSNGALVTGLAFTQSAQETSVWVIDGWIEPIDKYQSFPRAVSTQDSLRWSVSGCVVQVQNVSPHVLPYVFLQLSKLEGRLSDNWFLLLPAERKEVTLSCTSGVNTFSCCSALQHHLEILSLVDLFSS